MNCLPLLALLLALLVSTVFAAAARTAAAPPGGPSANNTVTKIQSWLEEQVSVSSPKRADLATLSSRYPNWRTRRQPRPHSSRAVLLKDEQSSKNFAVGENERLTRLPFFDRAVFSTRCRAVFFPLFFPFSAFPLSPFPLSASPQALDIQSQLAARLYADVNLAEYKALLANEKEPQEKKRANASAVAALAAYRVAVQALPFKQVSLDPLVDKLLEGLSAEELKKAGDVAYPAARKVVAAAEGNSGAFEYAGFRPAPAAPGSGKPGPYAFVPGQKSALYPQLGNSKLYVLGGGGEGRGSSSLSAKEVVDKDFKNFSALKAGTPEYEAALAQVARVGSLNSTDRTKDQAEIPGFWADGAATPTVAGHFVQIAAALLPANASLLQSAELLARVAVAVSDASTVGWVIKYRDLAARPLTALRRGGNGQGTSLSEPVPDWEPLLKTPPHPEYPSGHALTSGSAAEVLASWFGRDDVPFTTSTAAKGFGPRNFSSLRASAVEVGDSRLFGGIHYNKSVVDGNDIGREVAKRIDSAFNKTFGA